MQPYQEYLRLGGNPDERIQAYRELFQVQLSEENLYLISKAAHYCQTVSDDRFRERIVSKYGIKLDQMVRSRPRKKSQEDELSNI